LVSNGKRVWSQTFGRGNTADKKPSATAMYGVGSVSKTVTAIAVMQLVDAGKVSLDAPVVRYIPDFTMASPQYRQITVRMLLNHSAGLPGSDYADGISSKPIPSYASRVLSGLRTSHLKTTPGAMNVYCNDCFTLAGLVVERVSGMPYQDYVAENVFKPLGMKHSTYASSVPAPGSFAPVIQGGKAEPFQVTNIFASGGLLSTSHDMARLAMIFTGDGVVGGKRILSSTAVEQMGTDQATTTLKAAPPSGWRYGLGWDTVEGAGTTFSATSAGTIAQTMLLNALVETGAVKKMPKQITGKPAQDTATRTQIRKMSGIFLGQNTTLKVSEAKSRALRLSNLIDGKWVGVPGRFKLRNGGAFWSTKAPGQSIRSVKSWGRTYLVARSLGGTGTFYSDTTAGQRTRSGGSLSPAWQARVGHRWLLANEDPSSLNWTNAGTPAVDIATIPGLSGYLLAKGALVEAVPFLRHGQRYPRHHVPGGSAAVRSGPVRPRFLDA
jgi:CubicO group peptidase (beta-lactamase class C family)